MTTTLSILTCPIAGCSWSASWTQGNTEREAFMMNAYREHLASDSKHDH